MSEVFNLVAYVKARVDEAKKGFSSLRQSVQTSSDSMTELGTAGQMAAGILIQQFSQNVVRAFETFGRVTVDAAAGFELATARIIAASGKTGDEAEELIAVMEDATKTLGVEFGTGATGAMEAMEALVKAGLDPATEATVALRGVLQLAKIEQIATADAANMVVAAMAQFGLTAEEATRIVDGFVKASAAGIDTAAGYAMGLANVGATASAMGFSIEETLAALVQIDASQKDARKSGTFLNRMFLDLAAKSEDAGISLYNADGSMRSLDEIIGELRTKIQGFGSDQAALNEWMGQFQSLSQRAILSLVSYDGTIAETESNLITMTGAQEQANIVLDTYSGRLSVAQAEQENTAIGMGEVTSELSIMGAEFMASLGPVGLLAGSLGPPMLSGAMQGLSIVIIPNMLKTLGQMVFQMGFATTATHLLGSAINLMMGPVGWVILAVTALSIAWSQNWGGIQEKTKAVIDFIMGKLEWIRGGIKAFGDSVGGVLKWLGGRWKDLSDVVGLELGNQKEKLAAALDEQTAAIEKSYEEQVEAIKTSWTERHSAIDDAMSQALDASAAHYESLKASAEESHAKAIEDLQQHWIDQLEETVEGWDSVIQTYEDHYDQIVSDTETHYDDLISDAKEHASELLSTTTQSYDDQLSETGTFYDEMLAEQKAFLVEIREGRSRDLNDLELNFLLEKRSLEEALIGQRITSEEYEEKLSELEREYRDVRSDIRDDYRILELQAEDEFRTNEERINAERVEALEKIETGKADAITTIEDELKATVEGIEQAKTDEIVQINEERKDKLEEIRTSEAELEAEHAAELETLAENFENERKRILTEANKEKARLAEEHQLELKAAEAAFHAELEAAEEAHAKASEKTWGTLWSNLTEGVKTWAGNVINAAKNAYNKVKDWWDKATKKKDDVTATSPYIPPSGFEDQEGVDEYAQHGFEGWVDKPTRFLAGEAGPEYVSIGKPMAGGMVINLGGIHIGSIKNEVDEEMLQRRVKLSLIYALKDAGVV